MKRMILGFVLLDQLTKFLAIKLEAPHLTYNKGIVFWIEANDFVKLIVPLGLILFSLWASKNIKNVFLKKLYISLMVSGFLSNYLDRFSGEGVVDFILIPNMAIINLADIFLFLTQIILILNIKDEIKMNKEPIVQNL